MFYKSILLTFSRNIWIIRLFECNTRITSSTQTTLDLYVTSFPRDNIKAGVLMCDLSDHLPIHCLIPHKRPCQTGHKVLIRNYSEQNINKFIELLSAHQWHEITEATDVNTAYNAFLSTFVSFYNTCFPLKPLIQYKKSRKPWISKYLYKRIKHRNKLFQMFLISRKENDLQIFRKVRK